MRLSAHCMALMMSAIIAQQAVAETIVLRGGQVLNEPVLSVDMGGLHLGGEAPRTIGWDAVRTVTGAQATEAAEFSDISELAWRARVRLDRGDVALATPLFEELYQRCAGHTGPTPLLAAEGLARCELARGLPTAAVEPWLDSLRLRRLGARLAGEQEVSAHEEWVVRRPLVDGETLLVEELPPMWLDGPAVDGLAQALTEAISAAPRTNGPEDRLRAWYAIAATWESRRTADITQLTNLARTSLAPDAPSGERLVAAVVVARAGSPELRAQGRAILDGIVASELGTWREAWARVALGRSLLLEEDAADRDRGLIHLLHAPARFESSLPALSTMAIAHAAVEVANSGQDEVVGRLRSELATMANYHADARSALAWLDAALGSSKKVQERS